MALTDILDADGAPGEFSFARGNVGTLTEVTSGNGNEFTLPEGAGASAVFPAEGDVDFGVTYGATGTDQVGTLVQPIPDDVRSGVQYGADGTESTGTLSPGSGGGLISIVSE